MPTATAINLLYVDPSNPKLHRLIMLDFTVLVQSKLHKLTNEHIQDRIASNNPKSWPDNDKHSDLPTTPNSKDNSES